MHDALSAVEGAKTEALLVPLTQSGAHGRQVAGAACLEQLISLSWLQLREQRARSAGSAVLKPPGTFAEAVRLEELRE